MTQRLKTLLTILLVVLGLHGFALPGAAADDLDTLGVPVFRDRAGYGLAVTEYSMETEAELLEGESPEHEVEFSGLLQPPDGEDVLCFATTLVAASAKDKQGEDLLLPTRRRKKKQAFKALLPSTAYADRRGKPLLLSEVELDGVALNRPGYEITEMVVVATAVTVKERASETIDALVADRYIDIGHATKVKISSIEVDKKREMTVKLKIKRSGNNRSPVIDSLYALNKKGDPIGGGRWSNDLDLFAKGYAVEMAFPLTGGQDSIDQLQIVLATEYKIEEVKLKIQDLFQG